jgi:pyrimidine nucleoside transport protein
MSDIEYQVEEVGIEKFEDEEADEPKGFTIGGKSINSVLGMLLKGALALLLCVYLLAAFIIDFPRAKFLFIAFMLTLVYVAIGYFGSKNPGTVEALEDAVLGFLQKAEDERVTGLIVTAVLIGIMVAIAAATIDSTRNLISGLGLVVCVFITYIFSFAPRQVKWRPVLGSIFFQFIFGYIVIRTDWGLSAIQFLADQITYLLGYTYAGSGFVFGWLTDGSLFGQTFALSSGNAYSLAPPFFFNVLPQVIFFSALVNVLYYLRILPFLVRHLGYFLSLLLGTSASESLSAAGNIFIGQTEAPLLVKPFIQDMTSSELHAIMVGGFATIAGSVFGVYASFGVDPVALLASSVMSAPAALALSKLAYPELEESATAANKKNGYEIPKSDDVNVVHAASNGAVTGTVLMMNIAGNLVAALAIIAMLDNWLGYIGDKVDIFLSFNRICEVIFYPVAWLMGVDPADCTIVASLLGYKIFANEFVAYERLAFTYKGVISDRSYYIASYALSGFSNFGSIGIQLGGLTPLAPNQGTKLAKLVMSAMIVGNTACIMTACIAGLFYKV